MHIFNIATLALAASLGLGAAASAGETVRGPELPFGAGTVQSWVKLDGKDRPKQIGVSISEQAVAEVHHDMIFLTVPLPEAAQAAGYDHISLDWMPHGHEPDGLFGAPHYDVHFYLVPEAERLAVDPADPHYLDKAAREPLRDLMPTDFVPPPTLEPIPAMGVHWTDATHPIFQGEPFSHIFIYGAWDGEVTFLEPMITRDVFLTKKAVGAEVKQPASVAEAGWYPTRYRIMFDRKRGTHDVVLDDLTWREPGRKTAALRK